MARGGLSNGFHVAHCVHWCGARVASEAIDGSLPSVALLLIEHCLPTPFTATILQGSLAERIDKLPASCNTFIHQVYICCSTWLLFCLFLSFRTMQNFIFLNTNFKLVIVYQSYLN